MIAEVHGVKLFYEKKGKGTPLFLLHGNGEDHHIFDEIAEKLANHFTVYAVDSRNHGQSQMAGGYSYDIMVEDLYGLIQDLGLSRVYLVGFSDGAIIALSLAKKYKEIVEKMALLGVNLSPQDFTQESLQWIQDAYGETKDPLLQMMLEQPNIKWDALREVITPTLIVAAENDIFKPEIFVRLEQVLPDATLKIMEGHSHDSYIVHQDILYSDLIHFFSV